MELTVTTALAYADVGLALAAAFPGEGVSARQGAEEGTVDIALDNPARTEDQANAAIAAWSGGAAVLARAKLDAGVQIQGKLDQVLAAWTYTFDAVTYPVPITDSWMARVTTADRAFTLAGAPSTLKLPMGPGILVDMDQAQVEAMGATALTFEQEAATVAAAFAAAVVAAGTTDAVTAAVAGLDSGWPSP